MLPVQHNNVNNTAAGTGPGGMGPGATGYNDSTGYGGNAAGNDRVGPLGTGTGPTMQPAQPGYDQGTVGAGPGAHHQGGFHNNQVSSSSYKCCDTGTLTEDHVQAGVAGGDPYANTVGNNDVAPVQHFSNGQKTGTGSSTTGKIERAIGTMVCSSSLKAKGAAKEQQAQAYQAQRAEISEAERLEQEASMRRQRAVDHGEFMSGSCDRSEGSHSARRCSSVE